MDDPEYESTRTERGVQARKILELVASYRSSGKLLDIGSGAGILVEEALGLGYDAHGVEPSRWLQARAKERGLPVALGVFPHPELVGPFDLITVIDVLEHVKNPLGLLQDVRSHLSKDGLAVIVTPDVQSVAARLLGFRWWHYRVAHIGYFSRTTLTNALRRASLVPMSFQRPSWYFPASYLVERVGVYLPRPLRPRVPNFLSKLVVPLNLRDSMLVVVQPK
jgi:2-polyprenyl-3-methyl-5-hydroxy-6-metoxy-1,4-benzoquinol methylase